MTFNTKLLKRKPRKITESHNSKKNYRTPKEENKEKPRKAKDESIKIKVKNKNTTLLLL